MVTSDAAPVTESVPEASAAEKKSHGTSPTKRKSGYGASPGGADLEDRREDEAHDHHLAQRVHERPGVAEHGLLVLAAQVADRSCARAGRGGPRSRPGGGDSALGPERALSGVCVCSVSTRAISAVNVVQCRCYGAPLAAGKEPVALRSLRSCELQHAGKPWAVRSGTRSTRTASWLSTAPSQLASPHVRGTQPPTPLMLFRMASASRRLSGAVAVQRRVNVDGDGHRRAGVRRPFGVDGARSRCSRRRAARTIDVQRERRRVAAEVAAQRDAFVARDRQPRRRTIAPATQARPVPCVADRDRRLRLAGAGVKSIGLGLAPSTGAPSSVVAIRRRHRVSRCAASLGVGMSIAAHCSREGAGVPVVGVQRAGVGGVAQVRQASPAAPARAARRRASAGARRSPGSAPGTGSCAACRPGSRTAGGSGRSRGSAGDCGRRSRCTPRARSTSSRSRAGRGCRRRARSPAPSFHFWARICAPRAMLKA